MHEKKWCEKKAALASKALADYMMDGRRGRVSVRRTDFEQIVYDALMKKDDDCSTCFYNKRRRGCEDRVGTFGALCYSADYNDSESSSPISEERMHKLEKNVAALRDLVKVHIGPYKRGDYTIPIHGEITQRCEGILTELDIKVKV